MSRSITLPPAPDLWRRLRAIQHEKKVDVILITSVFDRLVEYAGTEVTPGRVDRAIWHPVKQYGEAYYTGNQLVFGMVLLHTLLIAIVDNEEDRRRVFDSNRNTRRKEERFMQSRRREANRKAQRKGRGKNRRPAPKRKPEFKSPDNVVSLDKHRAKRRTPPGTRSPQPPKRRRKPKEKEDDPNSGD